MINYAFEFYFSTHNKLIGKKSRVFRLWIYTEEISIFPVEWEIYRNIYLFEISWNGIAYHNFMIFRNSCHT